MTVFRWIIGTLSVLLAATALAGLVFGIAFDSNVWHERARRFRHWLWLILLFWFNFEVWGRVLLILIRWGR